MYLIKYLSIYKNTCLASRAREARKLLARETLAQRFTDFFTEFGEKTDSFAIYCGKISLNTFLAPLVLKILYLRGDQIFEL